MGKILILLVAGLFVCGSALAGSNYDSDNVMIFGPTMGEVGISPPTMIVKVTLTSEDVGVKGDVLVWDVQTNMISDGAGLGYAVRKCDINSASDEVDADMSQYTQFAGVLVTTTNSDDVGEARAAVRASGDEVGYMAIKGYADAKFFVGATVTRTKQQPVLGRALVLKGADLVASFGTTVSGDGGTRISQDIGLLLETPSATSGTLRRVWLN